MQSVNKQGRQRGRAFLPCSLPGLERVGYFVLEMTLERKRGRGRERGWGVEGGREGGREREREREERELKL